MKDLSLFSEKKLKSFMVKYLKVLESSQSPKETEKATRFVENIKLELLKRSQESIEQIIQEKLANNPLKKKKVEPKAPEPPAQAPSGSPSESNSISASIDLDKLKSIVDQKNKLASEINRSGRFEVTKPNAKNTIKKSKLNINKRKR